MAQDTRSTHDRPAAILASGLGVIAILGSIFFLPRFYCENPSATCTSSGPGGGALQFDVAWSKQVGNANHQTYTASGGKLEVHLVDIQAGAVVSIGACNDSATTPVQNPLQTAATITYTISDGKNTTEPKAFTCAGSANGGSELTLPAPKVATAYGSDADAAKATLATNPGVHSREVTYTVTVAVARPTGPVPPLVGPQNPTLSVEFTVQAMKYAPTLTPHKNEVGK